MEGESEKEKKERKRKEGRKEEGREGGKEGRKATGQTIPNPKGWELGSIFLQAEEINSYMFSNNQ
jgi:hypothetical protein